MDRERAVNVVYHASHIGLIIFLLCGLGAGGYFLYQKGYERGYAKAIKNNPPQSFSGTNYIYNNPIPKKPFAELKFWFLDLHTTK